MGDLTAHAGAEMAGDNQSIVALYKRGNVWWYEFEFVGRRYRGSTRAGSQKVALQIEAAKRVMLAKGEVGIDDPSDIPTLREFSRDFIRQIKMERAEKPRTVRFYEEKVARLLESAAIADVRLDRIDEDLVESYKRARTTAASRHGKPMAPASVNRELATLRRMLRMARDWNRIKAVPKIKLLKGETSREFVLSRADETRYLDAVPEGMKPLCEFLVETGLRVGEALRLEWQQIDLRAKPGFVTVRAAHSKSGNSRTVPLTTRARCAIEKIRPRDGIVFRTATGDPLYHTWLNQQHAAVRQALGFPSDFVLHSLRHTFGTRLGEIGAEAFTIMSLMGHSTVTVSQKYVHPSSKSMRLAMERMDAATKVHTKSPTTKKSVSIKQA